MKIIYFFLILFFTTQSYSATFYFQFSADALSSCESAISADPDLTSFGNTANCFDLGGRYNLRTFQNPDPSIFGILNSYLYTELSPTPSCESGLTTTVFVPWTDSNGDLMICIGSCSESISIDGCEYLIQTDPHSPNCFTDDSTSTFGCIEPATSTGTSSSPGLPNTYSSPPANPPTPDPDPCLDINGVNTCILSDDNKDAYELNGQSFEISTNPGCGSVNGTELCAQDPKNCGTFNGEYLCVTDSVPTVNANCYFNPLGTLCVSGRSGVKTDTQSTTTNNADGTTTIITNTTNNVTNGLPNTTTTRKLNSDGSTRSVKTRGDIKSTEDTNSISGTDQCNSLPICKGDPVLCAIALSSHEENCRFSEPLPTAEEILTAIGGSATPFNSPLSPISDLDSSGFGLSRSCPAPKHYQILSNVSFDIDLSAFCSIAEIVGTLILLTASFISLRILSTA